MNCSVFRAQKLGSHLPHPNSAHEQSRSLNIFSQGQTCEEHEDISQNPQVKRNRIFFSHFIKCAYFISLTWSDGSCICYIWMNLIIIYGTSRFTDSAIIYSVITYLAAFLFQLKVPHMIDRLARDDDHFYFINVWKHLNTGTGIFYGHVKQL